MRFFLYGTYYQRLIFIIVIGMIIFSGGIVYWGYIISTELAKKARTNTQIFAKFTTAATDSNYTNKLLDIVYEEIIRKIDFPVILTDSLNNPQAWSRVKGIPEATSAYSISDKIKQKLYKEIKKMDDINEPLKIKTNDNKIISVVHFGESALQKEARLFPFLLVVFFIFFVGALVYILYLFQQREKNFLWRGLAKETAHQLGTPISALMGWSAILETLNVDKEIIYDINQDIDRLKRVANRFSQIGSTPQFKKIDLISTLNDVIAYFAKRNTKKVKFLLISDDAMITIDANEYLIKWAFENMVKNSIDAISKNQGQIEFKLLKSKDGKHIIIRVHDNGDGIPVANQKRIFTTGFSTKKRGWGVGLTLTKRIIEQYHKGKLKLVESSRQKGTTFEIILNRELSQHSN